MPKNEEAVVGAAKDLEQVDDPGDQPRIPGTERKAVKPLIDYIKRREAVKADHKQLTAELKEMNDVEGPALFTQYKEHFEETDDAYIYTAGKYEMDLTKNLKVKTSTVADEN
jgi:hypothetical protein